MKWKYDLGICGTSLRLVIRTSSDTRKDAARILNEVNTCCGIIHGRLAKARDTHYLDDIDELMLLIKEDIAYFEESETPIEEIGFDDFKDMVNDRLSQFYDLCKNAAVWIPL